MGCASSSTPMVATAGSEMLKTATQVADDAKHAAEGAVEEVTTTLSKTIGNAKETMSNALAEVDTSVKQQSSALEETKNQLLEKLHLSENTSTAPTAAAGDPINDINTNGTSVSHASTPAHDADSLKTSSPEPEIEQALANTIDDENPPTPKPTLAELAQLTAVVATATQATGKEAPPAAADASAMSEVALANEQAPVAEPAKDDDHVKSVDISSEQKRPSTTEWEKFADMLANNRKFKPYETFSQNVNKFSVYQDYTRSRDSSEPQYDGSFSDVNTLTSLSQSSLSSPHFSRARILPHTQPIVVPPLGPVVAPPLVPAVVSVVSNLPISTTPVGGKRTPREFASLLACEQPAVITRRDSKSNLAIGRAFDFNPNRERVSLPLVTQRISSPVIAAVSKTGSWGRQAENTSNRSDVVSPLPSIASGTPHKIGAISRSSHSSSTSSGVVIKSNLTTPSTMSPERTLLPTLDKLEELDSIPNEATPIISTPGVGRSRSRSRRTSNTSSFLNSPHVSPFFAHKNYDNKENKLAPFVAELSSVTPKRSVLSTSPYKIRERCEVCYNKYVIQ